MTLLESIYTQLQLLQLARNAQAFSTEYLAKNKNWYSYQTHMGRDLTFSTAVSCAFYMRSLLQQGALSEAQRDSVTTMLRDIKTYLAEQHRVTWITAHTGH